MKIEELDPATSFDLLKIRISTNAARKEAFVALFAITKSASR